MTVPAGTQGGTTKPFITRHRATRDGESPWATMDFAYDIESDSLHEKLKAAYPNCRTLKERKHQAAIEFLAEELRIMRIKDSVPPLSATSPGFPHSIATPEDSKDNIQTDSSRQQSFSTSTSPSASSHVCSPGLADRMKRSPSGTHAELVRPSSKAQGSTFVFSAVDGKDMRPKTKRKMTLEERSAYKETRKRGACDKCRRQKGRCTHIIEDGRNSKEENNVNNPHKRRRSAALEPGKMGAPKAIKIEDPSNVHPFSSEEEHQLNPSIPTQPTSGNLPMLPVGTNGSERWRGRGGSNGFSPGCVPPEHPMAPYGFSQQWSFEFPGDDPQPFVSTFSGDPSAARNMYHSTSEMHGSSEDVDVINNAFHTSPAITGSPTDLSLQAEYSFFEPPWPDAQNQGVGRSGPTRTPLPDEDAANEMVLSEPSQNQSYG